MRLPDFIVIGTAKSGTTTLYRWLSAQPETVMPLDPNHKEPHFFVSDDRWSRGLEWYASLFADVPADRLTGEASPGYTHPRHAPVAVERIGEIVPEARLVCILRHPLDRLRSAYRHGLQGGHRPVPLEQAVRSSREPLVERSLYHLSLEPYFRRFPREQICIVRFEDVTGGDHEGWRAVLRHVGLPDDRPPPATAHNVSARKEQYPRWVSRLLRSGRAGAAARLPAAVRKGSKGALQRFGPEFDEHLELSTGPVPHDVVTELRADAAKLEALLGRGPLWSEESWSIASPPARTAT